MNPKTEHNFEHANAVSLEIKTNYKVTRNIGRRIGRTVKVVSQSQHSSRVFGKKRTVPKKNEKNNDENSSLILLKKCDRKQMIDQEKVYFIILCV